MNSMMRIAWITIRELVFEKVFYLIIGFATGSLIVSLLLGQLTYSEQSKIIIDFMLGGIQISSILFSVFMSISLLHRELHQGSVFMVLSKPVTRWSFLMGKYLGLVTVLSVVIALMGAISMGFGSAYETFSAPAMIQSLLMIGFEGYILTAVTCLFAINSGAVTSALAALSVFAIGHSGSSVERELASDSASWTVVRNVFPNFELFNIKAYTSYGLLVPWGDVGFASLYTLGCLTFFLAAAVLCFNHRDIMGT